MRTAVVVGVAVAAALGGGIAIAANAPAPSQVVSPPASPAQFVGIAPVRVLDTRNAAGGPIGISPGHKLAAGETIDVAVGGVGAIPADATSVAINITIDEDATLKSFLTVWPTGETRPNTSANNAEPGLVSPNSAIFQLGTGGKLSVFNQQGTVNVIIDVTGYFVASGTGGTTTTTAPGGTTTTSTTAAVTRALTTDATDYAVGATVTFNGTGWTDCTAINVDLVGPGGATVATALTPAVDGSITGTFTAPAPGGSVTLHAAGTGTSCTADSAAFTITAV